MGTFVEFRHPDGKWTAWSFRENPNCVSIKIALVKLCCKHKQFFNVVTNRQLPTLGILFEITIATDMKFNVKGGNYLPYPLLSSRLPQRQMQYTPGQCVLPAVGIAVSNSSETVLPSIFQRGKTVHQCRIHGHSP